MLRNNNMSYNYKDKNFSTKAITFSCDADIIYVWHVLIENMMIKFMIYR